MIAYGRRGMAGMLGFGKPGLPSALSPPDPGQWIGWPSLYGLGAGAPPATSPEFRPPFLDYISPMFPFIGGRATIVKFISQRVRVTPFIDRAVRLVSRFLDGK